MKTNNENETNTAGALGEGLVVVDEAFEYVETAREAEARGEAPVDMSAALAALARMGRADLVVVDAQNAREFEAFPTVDGHDAEMLRAELEGVAEEMNGRYDALRGAPTPPPDAEEFTGDTVLGSDWLRDAATGEWLRPSTIGEELRFSAAGRLRVPVERDVVVEYRPSPRRRLWRYWLDRLAPVAWCAGLVWALFAYAPAVVGDVVGVVTGVAVWFGGLTPLGAAAVLAGYLTVVTLAGEAIAWAHWRSQR